MNTKHTKGNWSVKSNRELTWVETDSDLESKIICTMSSNDKCEANAKLIAAAPDLLEALQKLLDRLDSQHHSLAISGTLRECREAIKKATL